MRSMFLAVSMVAILTACVRPSAGEPVRWKKGDGGNNHYYEVVLVGGPVSWEEAAVLAEAEGGYLATITSSDENDFVIPLLRDLAFWTDPGSGGGTFRGAGPWIGGYQEPGSDEPDGGWFWLTGEEVQFPGNWCAGEPNNYYGPGWDENRMNYFYIGSVPLDEVEILTFTPGWNDSPGDAWPGPVVAYVIEWDKNPNRMGGRRHGRPDPDPR